MPFSMMISKKRPAEVNEDIRSPKRRQFSALAALTQLVPHALKVKKRPAEVEDTRPSKRRQLGALSAIARLVPHVLNTPFMFTTPVPTAGFPDLGEEHDTRNGTKPMEECTLAYQLIYPIPPPPPSGFHNLPVELIEMIYEDIDSADDRHSFANVCQYLAKLFAADVMKKMALVPSPKMTVLKGHAFKALWVWRHSRDSEFFIPGAIHAIISSDPLQSYPQTQLLCQYLRSLPKTTKLYLCLDFGDGVPDHQLAIIHCLPAFVCDRLTLRSPSSHLTPISLPGSLPVLKHLRYLKLNSSAFFSPRAFLWLAQVLSTSQISRLDLSSITSSEMSAENWQQFLQGIRIPCLQQLALEGDIPFQGIHSMLSHHPSLRLLHLGRVTCPWVIPKEPAAPLALPNFTDLRAYAKQLALLLPVIVPHSPLQRVRISFGNRLNSTARALGPISHALGTKYIKTLGFDLTDESQLGEIRAWLRQVNKGKGIRTTFDSIETLIIESQTFRFTTRHRMGILHIIQYASELQSLGISRAASHNDTHDLCQPFYGLDHIVNMTVVNPRGVPNVVGVPVKFF